MLLKLTDRRQHFSLTVTNVCFVKRNEKLFKLQIVTLRQSPPKTKLCPNNRAGHDRVRKTLRNSSTILFANLYKYDTA